MSLASNDEFLDEVIENFGLEGYARWWLILETIAAQMDGSNKCSVTYSWSKWQKILHGKRKKLLPFLEQLAAISVTNQEQTQNVSGTNPERPGNEPKMFLKQNGNTLEIGCPKLLILRDNYTKDLEVTSKQEVEVEVDKETNVNGDAVDVPAGKSQEAKPKEKTPDKIPDCPYGKIVDLYHEHCPSLARVKILDGTRKKHLRARWRSDTKHQALEFWETYFAHAATSPFLCGDNDRNWSATFDFLITESKFINVIEGHYHNNGARH